jgi:hypothetical protein
MARFVVEVIQDIDAERLEQILRDAWPWYITPTVAEYDADRRTLTQQRLERIRKTNR